MASDDLSYFRARAVEERERASSASSAAIRTVHLDFANKYDQLVSGLRSTSEVQLSRDAIRRSFDLLSATSRLIAE